MIVLRLVVIAVVAVATTVSLRLPAALAARIPPHAPQAAAAAPSGINRFTVDELLSLNCPARTSDDIDVDICKASGFYGDIARPMLAHQRIQHYFAQPTTAGHTTTSSSSSTTTTTRPITSHQPTAHGRAAAAAAAASRRRHLKAAQAAKKRRQRQQAKVQQQRRRAAANKKRLNTGQKQQRNGGGASGRRSGRPARSLSDNDDHDDDQQLQLISRPRRAAIANRQKLWSHAVIPYEIERKFTGEQRALFKRAMQHWELHTCIRFVERDSAGSVNVALNHTDYVLFTERDCGCCSYVARQGNGAQAISIGPNCDTFGVVVHEIGHAIGFYHEHTRPDRDQHVRVLSENVAEHGLNNFKIMPGIDSLGQPYDFDSIMHYADTQLARRPGLVTFELVERGGGGATAAAQVGERRPFGAIGQREALSAGDIVQANLLYGCAACGGTLQAASGRFGRAAGQLEGDAAARHCEWRITATAGERIALRLSDLHIGRTPAANDCSTDYLEIRDGYFPGAPLLRRLCGGATQQLLLLHSTTNRMLVTLHSSQPSSSTFAASYETVCGGELHLNTSRSARIESPNYPASYRPNMDCVWTVTASAGYAVGLIFDAFDLEQHAECALDSVELRDGGAAEAPLLGRLCGFDRPAPVRSSGTQMRIRFRSDGRREAGGFSVRVVRERDECALGEHRCNGSCINTLGAYRCECAAGLELHSNQRECEQSCGGVIEVRAGAQQYSNGSTTATATTTTTTTTTLVSPSFPDLYPPDKECVWELRAPAHHRITLRFTHFDLEDVALYTQDCEADALTIVSLDGAGRNATAHGALCGRAGVLPAAVLSTTERLRVTFRSDHTIQKTGFALIYGLDVDECALGARNGGCMHECRNRAGGFECRCRAGFALHANGLDCVETSSVACSAELTALSGRIASPGWPAAYPPHAVCRWLWRTLPGHHVRVRLGEFDVEPSFDCAADQVAAFNGATERASTIGVFCRRREELRIESTAAEMLMVFQSNGHVQRAGFAGEWRMQCGGVYRASAEREQRIYSHHGWDGRTGWAGEQRCEWQVMAAEFGEAVSVRFVEWDMRAAAPTDWLEVLDGSDEFDALSLRRFDAATAPTTETIVSTTDRLVIRFRARASGGRGFVIGFRAVAAPVVGGRHME